MSPTSSFLVFTALCLTSASAIDWKNLFLKFDVLFDGYFPIPLTQEELLKGNWAYMASDSDINVDFYCLGNDPRVAIGFDIYGNIAGVRVSYILADLSIKAEQHKLNYPYDFSTQPLYSTGTFLGKDVYYTTVLFVSPEKLKAGGRNEDIYLLGEELYVKINGNYTQMPREEKNAPSLGFTEQACFVGMGKHYFLGMTKDAECGDLPGVFLLYEGGELIGMGLIPFGSFTSSERTWFESPTASVAKMIAPNSPECLEEWTTNFGLIGLHLFFKSHPRLTFCL